MAGSGPVLLLFRIEAIITFYEKAPPIRRLEVQTGTEKNIRTMRLTTPFHPNIIAYTEKFRYVIFKQQVGLNANMLGEIMRLTAPGKENCPRKAVFGRPFDPSNTFIFVPTDALDMPP